MDGKHTGMGARLLMGDGASPENFVQIAGVTNIDGPGITRDTHDTSDMNLPDNYRTFKGGMVDPGELSFTMHWIPRDASQSQDEGGLLAEFDRSSCDSERNFRILLPECEGEADGYWEVRGILTGFEGTMPMDDLMTADVSIKLSGRPELVLEAS